MKVQSATELAEQVARDPVLREQIKADPAGVIASLAEPLRSDVWIYRIVVGALGLVVIIAITGALFLAGTSSKDFIRTVPDAVIALGSAAVGALAGLLAPSPASRR